MLIQGSSPLDYRLCDQTVTVYRKRGQEILRLVVEGCYLQRQAERSVDTLGCRVEHSFLLVMPGETQRVFPGDRIMAGIGPEIGPEDWAGFLPAAVDGLYEAEYAAPYYWDGAICHVEAGRK